MSKAKARALSSYWGHHQRFFSYLMNALKIPSLIANIEEDLRNGYAVVLQLITTSEALLDRKLSQIPSEEWDDIKTDISPKEAVIEYIQHCFPTELWEEYREADGKTKLRQVLDDQGNPVHSQEALRIKQETILGLALLPSIPTVLDAIIWHFGTENVAEVTGRTKRVVKNGDQFQLRKRSGQASLAETNAFMDGNKNILIFSQAGGTGRSYHADVTRRNQKPRKHYLVESGYSASVALQGLGRSHRASQVVPPVFVPVTLNIKGIKRFDSAIARKVEVLGALTKGSRKTGSQNIWAESDNLENIYARMALQDLFAAIYYDRIEGINPESFQTKMGLTIRTSDGQLTRQMPPINQFLNRLMALEVQEQNLVFEAFENFQQGRIQEALDSGTYETGVENLKAEGFRVLEEILLYTHPTGNKTHAIKLEKRDRIKVLSLSEIELLPAPRYFWNARSNKATLGQDVIYGINNQGTFEHRMRLYSPDGDYQTKTYPQLETSHWQEIPFEEWERIWQTQVDQLEEFRYSIFYLIVGMLTPVYSRFPKENMKIYRLQADDGRIFLGRFISDTNINQVLRSFGLLASEILSPEELWTACYVRHQTHPLTENWKLTSSRVAGEIRLEITGVHDRQSLCALSDLGCFTEIMAGQLRVFVPAVEEEAKEIIARILPL